MQFSFSGTSKVRNINLAGSSSTQSSETLLAEVRARRQAREAEQRRHDSATAIAAWWHNVRAQQAVRKQYADIFDSGPEGLSPIEWTRALLICGTNGDRGEARLGRWSGVFVKDNDALFSPFSTRNATQWLDILCRLSVRLLQAIPASPQSPSTINHLTIIQNLLIPDRMPKHLPPATTQDIARSVITTVIPAKASKSLSRFKETERRDYLNLLAAVFGSLPTGTLDPRKSISASVGNTAAIDNDSDTDSDAELAPVTAQAPVQPTLSPRTLKRLEQLTDAAYLTALLGSLGSQTDVAICRFFIGLWSAWPTRKNAKDAATLALPTGSGTTSGAYGIVKGIWRNQIRPTIGILGDGTGEGTQYLEPLVDDATANLWPPLVFLTVLYTHMLRTMSDDEFFSTQIGQTPQTQSAQNPLSTSEVAHLGRSLLGVVFRLYLHELVIGTRRVPGLRDINFGMVREWGTELLQSICLRDSRRKFTPEGHWLMVDASDAQQIRAAALLEEEEASNSETSFPTSRSGYVTSRTTRAQLASLSPRSKILTHIPFSIPFDV
ncbi:hypothetical protein RSAG8_00166, partial [Rhizoctonia solani AG-8 WAC10335]